MSSPFRFQWLLAPGAWLTVVVAITVPAAAAETLPLKRVMLSTGGVGYFEHEATVDGDAELELEVRLDQVDDVLKSVVVYDDQGAVGRVSLPGRAPLQQVFRDLPFGPEALASPVALLNALQGAEVRAVGARALQGRLLRVTSEATRLPDNGGTVTRHRVTLMTADGLQHLIFEEAEALQFVEPRLQAQVERALAAMATHRVRDKRTLTVVAKGAGRRTVRLAYVVAAPLWKATYRLTLGEGAADGGLLQGWAVVENMSGRAWEGVELTLLSGNPVTFRQALYATYYVDRPEVPVEVLGRILPRPDSGVVGGEAAMEEREELEKGGAGGRAEAPSRPRALMAPMVAEEAADLAAAPPAPGVAPPHQVSVSEEAATQVVFRLPGTLDVETGHSFMVPLVNRPVPARRLSLYQPDTHATHPLATVRLGNDTGAGLPPGVLTLYERGGQGTAVAYVGDARLATFPLGEERLVSFALDQKTRISREVRQTRETLKAAVDRGVMRLTVALSQTTAHRVKAPEREDRVILVEVPRRADWALTRPPQEEVELTETHYRIERRVAAGGEDSFEVTMQRPVVETVRIATLSLERMLAYAGSTELSDEVRRAFARMAELQREVGRHERGLQELEAKRRTIFEEQDRIRSNMNRVPRESDIYRRYLTKLDAQESELEAMAGEMEETRQRIAEASEALSRFIQELEI